MYPSSSGTETILTGALYDPTVAIEDVDESIDYLVAQADRVIILRVAPKDIALLNTNGGRLRIREVVNYAFYLAVNDDRAAELAAVIGGLGRRVLLIQDNAITSNEQAQNTATNQRDLKTQKQYTLTFTTNDLAWRVGQTINFIDTVVGLDITLIVQSISWSLVSIDDHLNTESWKGTVQAATLQIENPGTVIARGLSRALRPQKRPPIQLLPE